MKRVVSNIIVSLVLMLLTQAARGQFSTDNRVIFEHMRYSREKAFNTWSVSLGYGFLIMYNDLADYTVFPKHWKFGPNIMVAKQLVPAWSFDFQFLSGSFNAGNSIYYSKGDLLDFSLNGRTYINQLLALPGPVNDKWNFYFKLGIGLSVYRTRVRYANTGDFVHFGDFGSGNEEDGYIVLGYDKNDPHKKESRAKELIVPMGFGVQYRINRSFDIGFESTMRFSLEDKLDNILIGSENDKYWSASVSISYKIGKKDKRHSRWTYRDYGFNVLGSPKADPLADEIMMLEEEFEKYREGRVVKKDSLTIVHNVQKIYGTANLASVFFELEKYNEVDKEALTELAVLALDMVKNKSYKACIYSYSNEYDDPGKNMEISRKRCERVLTFFVRDLGLDRERFALQVLGEADVLPQQLSTKKSRLSINRRVDVVLIK